MYFVDKTIKCYSIIYNDTKFMILVQIIASYLQNYKSHFFVPILQIFKMQHKKN